MNMKLHALILGAAFLAWTSQPLAADTASSTPAAGAASEPSLGEKALDESRKAAAATNKAVKRGAHWTKKHAKATAAATNDAVKAVAHNTKKHARATAAAANAKIKGAEGKPEGPAEAPPAK